METSGNGLATSVKTGAPARVQVLQAITVVSTTRTTDHNGYLSFTAIIVL